MLMIAYDACSHRSSRRFLLQASLSIALAEARASVEAKQAAEAGAPSMWRVRSQAQVAAAVLEAKNARNAKDQAEAVGVNILDGLRAAGGGLGRPGGAPSLGGGEGHGRGSWVRAQSLGRQAQRLAALAEAKASLQAQEAAEVRRLAVGSAVARRGRSPPPPRRRWRCTRGRRRRRRRRLRRRRWRRRAARSRRPRPRRRRGRRRRGRRGTSTRPRTAAVVVPLGRAAGGVAAAAGDDVRRGGNAPGSEPLSDAGALPVPGLDVGAAATSSAAGRVGHAGAAALGAEVRTGGR